MNKKNKYYNETFGKEDFILQSIRHQAKQDGLEFMQLDPADAHILQFLTQLSKTQNAVEIGGLYGYSTLHIARGLSSDGKLFSLDMDKKRQQQSQKLLSKDSCFSKIKWIHGDAHETLKTLNDQAPFDLIFIDADKSGYWNYLQWAQENLKKGGLVVADNTFLFDTLFTDEPELSPLRKKHSVSLQSIKALTDFNRQITSTSFWKGAMIPTENGMGVAIKIQ